MYGSPALFNRFGPSRSTLLGGPDARRQDAIQNDAELNLVTVHKFLSKIRITHNSKYGQRPTSFHRRSSSIVFWCCFIVDVEIKTFTAKAQCKPTKIVFNWIPLHKLWPIVETVSSREFYVLPKHNSKEEKNHIDFHSHAYPNSNSQEEQIQLNFIERHGKITTQAQK